MLQIIIIIITLAADQLSKYLLTPVLLEMPQRSIPVVQDVFHLTYVENRGASFGMLQNAQIFFIIITTIVLIAAFVFMIKNRKKLQSAFFKISLALIISGALGNYIDRIFFGYVRDLFDFRLINFWVFNVADSCLVIGAIMLGIYILFIYKEADGKPLLAKRGKENADEQDIGE